MIAESGRDIILGVDGGVTKENIAQVAATGADLIVTGSAVFDGKTRKPMRGSCWTRWLLHGAGSRHWVTGSGE